MLLTVTLRCLQPVREVCLCWSEVVYLSLQVAAVPRQLSDAIVLIINIRVQLGSILFLFGVSQGDARFSDGVVSRRGRVGVSRNGVIGRFNFA